MAKFNKGRAGFIVAIMILVLICTMLPLTVWADSAVLSVPFTPSTAPLPDSCILRFVVDLNPNDPYVSEFYIVLPWENDIGDGSGGLLDGRAYSMNGAYAYLDPVGRVMVPVRYLGNALKAQTDWDAATQTVALTRGSTTIEMVIGSKMLYVNGVAQQMDVAPSIQGGRTYLPLRFVADAFGLPVSPTLPQVPQQVGHDQNNMTEAVDININLPSSVTAF